MIPNKRLKTLACIGLLSIMVFSGCSMLRGDPRKNCNHPDHGAYMREQQMKNFNKY